MSKFLKCSFLALSLLISNNVSADDDNSVATESVASSESNENNESVEAPNYDRLLPIIGWNRYSGDSAHTLREWKRWWTYLRMEKTTSMKWIDGLRLQIYPRNEVFRALYVRGIYDPNLIVAINSLLPSKGVFIDVGANMGYCSLLMSKAVGEDGRVFAIEPSERDFLRLVDNVNMNQLKNVSVYRLAVTDKIGKVDISIASEERSALNTLGTEFSNKGIEKVKTETVESVTLDEFVARENIARVDVIKMDIEGSEVKALKGAVNTIEKYRPTIFLGLNENSLKANGTSVKEFEKVLADLRYKIYDLIETPFFAFKEVKDLKHVKGKFIVCLHESFIPPVLPQAKKESWGDLVKEFFTK